MAAEQQTASVEPTTQKTEDKLGEFRRKLGEFEVLLGRSVAKISKLERELDAARAQNAWFQRQLFGKKGERVPAERAREAWLAYCAEQEAAAKGRKPPAPVLPTSTTSYQFLIEFPTADAVDHGSEKQGPVEQAPATARALPSSSDTKAAPSEPPAKPKPKRHNHGRKAIPDHLPSVSILLEPDPSECPPGARALSADVSYRLALRKAEIVRIAIVRPRHAVDQDDADQTTRVVVADPPDEMIARGLFAPSGLAHIIAGKFEYHMPWTRLARFWSTDDYQISVSTLSGVAIRAAPYARSLVEAMELYAREVAPTLAIDASTARIFRKPGDNRGYAWVRYIEGVCTLLDFTAKHDSEVAGQLLHGWDCPTLADGANVYDAKHRETGKPRGGCWSHGRRRLVYAAPNDGRALVGIELIGRLFAIEAELVDTSHEVRLAERKRRSAPIVTQIFDWRDRLLADSSVARGSGFSKGLRYLVNQADRLTYFLQDGKIAIHNNRTELQIRHFAVGRRNWMSFGSERAAAAAATWLSLILSAKMHRLGVESYLRDLFRVLPSWPRTRLLELAPHRWLETRARLDPVQLEQELGPLTVPAALQV